MQEISQEKRNKRLGGKLKHVGGPITGKYNLKRESFLPDNKRDTDVENKILETAQDLQNYR